MSTERLLELLNSEIKQDLEAKESENKKRWPVLNDIVQTFQNFNSGILTDYEQEINNLGLDGRDVINQLRRIIFLKRDIDINYELVREPVDIFLKSNNIIITSLDADLLVGKFFLNSEKKKVPDIVFARTFFTHFEGQTLTIEDFCFGEQIILLAIKTFLNNVLGENPDPAFISAVKKNQLDDFVSTFFIRDISDYPEILAFIVTE